MVKFMEGEITFGLCLEFSEVVKKKWTALQTLMWRGLQNTSCDRSLILLSSPESPHKRISCLNFSISKEDTSTDG